ncbi:MAG: rSAM-modified peptide [Candidatus Azobacteroides sp.]|nr:rSAM-modified peptide [Candidatus Azobacteroides sp.]
MKKLVFESLSKDIFTPMEVEKMKRVKGGYTMNTYTIYSSGGSGDDGGGCSCDGVCGD